MSRCAIMNKHSSAVTLLICMLAGCAGPPPKTDAIADDGAQLPAQAPMQTTRDGTSMAGTIHEYKRVLADRIASTNSVHMYVGRPQALLRSVIVIKFQIDADGKLVRSDILRSNRDRTNEAVALASLKTAAPFPKPAGHLLKQGKVEVMESWLFNTDGRFQVRTTAEPQMDR